MHLQHLLLPALAVIGQVTAQGIDMHMVLSKQPKLSKATNTKSHTTNTQAVARSILSKLELLKPTVVSTTAVITTTKSTSTHVSTRRTTLSKTKSSSKSSSKKITSLSKTKTTSTKKERTSTNKKATTTSQKKHSSTKHKISVQTNSASHLFARQAQSCLANPILYNYTPSNNTAAGFLVDSFLTGISQAASGYLAGFGTAFANAYGSANAPNYLTYIQLPSYNTTACAAACQSISGCQSFNIYYERAPVVIPGPNCTNPSAAAIVKCAMWGSVLNSTMAVNIGEWRSAFVVVISGSSGFTVVPPPSSISNYGVPIALAGAINTSGYLVNGVTPFAGATYFPGVAYSPQSCANACNKQTASNKGAAVLANATSYIPCNYFNALDLQLNGVSQGTYCQFYSSDVSSQAGLYTTSMNNVTYSLQRSYGFVAAQQNNGVITSTSSPGGVNSTVSCPANNGQSYQVPGTPYAYNIACYNDFYGNDLSYVPNLNFQQCLATCANTTGCVAVSLSGVACYMKKAVGNPVFSDQIWGAYLNTSSAPFTSAVSTTTATPLTTPITSTISTTPTVAPTPGGLYNNPAVSCPSYNNTYYTSMTNLTWSITCGFDYSGATLTSYSVSNMSQCIEYCANTTSCITADLSGSGCYLKSQVGNSYNTNPNVWAARLVNPNNNYALIGQTTSTTATPVSATTASGTTASGTTASGTTASTTTGPATAYPPGPTSSSAPSCPASNGTYYQSSSISNASFYLQCATDTIGGGNINVQQISTWQGCIAYCATTSGCLAATYANGYCYQKGQYFNTTSSANVQYAVLNH